MATSVELTGEIPEEQLFRPQWSWSKGIALPFALAGLSGGWMAATLLSLDGVDLVPRGLAEESAIVGGLLALCCGVFLSLRRIAPADADRFSILRILVAVLLTGAISGGLVDLLTYQPGAFGARTVFYAGLVNGSLGVIPFIPVGIVVVRLAIRASRARRGSIVAGADRCAIWMGFAGALAGGSLCVWPAWFDPRHLRDVGMPWPALMVAAGCAAVAIWTFVRAWVDVIRLSHLQRITHQWVLVDAQTVARSVTAARTDLGVGDGRRASHKTTGTAYRGKRETTAVLLGDPGVAAQILERSRRRSGVVVLITLAVVTLHLVAAGAAVSPTCITNDSADGDGCVPP